MPFIRDDQKALAHALVGFGKTGDRPDRGYPSLKIVPHLPAILTIVHSVDVVMGQFNSHLTV